LPISDESNDEEISETNQTATYRDQERGNLTLTSSLNNVTASNLTTSENLPRNESKDGNQAVSTLSQTNTPNLGYN
jgi:hypothetical protein